MVTAERTAIQVLLAGQGCSQDREAPEQTTDREAPGQTDREALGQTTDREVVVQAKVDQVRDKVEDTLAELRVRG